jgi:hypothetical protein
VWPRGVEREKRVERCEDQAEKFTTPRGRRAKRRKAQQSGMIPREASLLIDALLHPALPRTPPPPLWAAPHLSYQAHPFLCPSPSPWRALASTAPPVPVTRRRTEINPSNPLLRTRVGTSGTDNLAGRRTLTLTPVYGDQAQRHRETDSQGPMFPRTRQGCLSQ